MNKRVTRLLAMTMAVLCMGMPLAGAEFQYNNPDAGTDWYQAMLTNAQLSLGNNYRLLKLIERSRAGENITVTTIGGSITEGAGASVYAECWANRFAEGFRALYGAGDGSNVHFVNAGVGGTPSPFGWMRYQRDLVDRVTDDDGLPDLVVIEFAVNDYGEVTNHQAYESMVKAILEQPNEPVVILLFSVFRTGFVLQNELAPIGRRYDLMMVSMKNSAFPLVNNKWPAEAWFSDEYHPTSLGHGIMADCILSTVQAAAAQAPSETDIDLSVAPVYGTGYMNMRNIFGSSDVSDLTFDCGGFGHDDTNSYRNTPVGRVCGKNFHHNVLDGDRPLTFTATFSKLLIAWRNVNDPAYGEAEVWVDGRKIVTFHHTGDAWGQSVVSFGYSSNAPAEHEVEIRMAAGQERKLFTITCISLVP